VSGAEDVPGAPDVEVATRHVRIGGDYAATLAVTGYPAEVSAGWLEPLTAYPGRLDVTLHIEPIPVGFLEVRVGSAGPGLQARDVLPAVAAAEEVALHVGQVPHQAGQRQAGWRHGPPDELLSGQPVHRSRKLARYQSSSPSNVARSVPLNGSSTRE